MKRADINRVFTEKVSQYIAEGYIFNLDTMRGHQGEDGKVDLVKDNELIRIWTNLEYTSSNDRLLVLRVGKWIHPSFAAYPGRTVWMDDLNTFEEIKYYSVSRDDDWYVTDPDESAACIEKHWSRYQSRRKSPIFLNSPKYKEIAAKYLKRKVGYKRVSTDDVVVSKADHGYYVYYHQTSYHIV